MFLQSLTSRKLETWKKNKSTCSLELLCITSAEQSQVSCGKQFSFWFFHEWCNPLQNKVHRTNFCTWKMKTCQREDRQAKKEGTKNSHFLGSQQRWKVFLSQNARRNNTFVTERLKKLPPYWPLLRTQIVTFMLTNLPPYMTGRT